MKDHRFIELVNLYIDRQISPVEAAELETELQANPRRRQVYNQYCRMHRATRHVYESFRQDAEREAPAPVGRGGVLVRLESARRRRHRWAYAAAGMATAACIALVVARMNPENESQPDGRIAATPAPTGAIPVATVPQVPERVQVSLGADDSPVGLASLRNPLLLEEDYQALLAAREMLTDLPLQNAAGQPRSLFDDDIFAPRSVFSEQGVRPYRIRAGGRRNEKQVENIGFQFQR